MTRIDILALVLVSVVLAVLLFFWLTADENLVERPHQPARRRLPSYAAVPRTGLVMSIEDGYVLAACLDRYFDEPSAVFSRYEDIRKDRTSMVVRKASENKNSAFEPRLADKQLVAVQVAREWQQVRLRERMDWLYNYDATSIAI